MLILARPFSIFPDQQGSKAVIHCFTVCLISFLIWAKNSARASKSLLSLPNPKPSRHSTLFCFSNSRPCFSSSFIAFDSAKLLKPDTIERASASCKPVVQSTVLFPFFARANAITPHRAGPGRPPHCQLHIHNSVKFPCLQKHGFEGSLILFVKQFWKL